MPALSKLNYIDVGPGGTFKPSGNPNYDTTAADVDAIFAMLQASGKKKILVYFHGGLVSEESGMRTAVAVTEMITAGTDVHPISFIWETGLIETVSQNIGDIWKTKFFQKLLEKAIKIAGSKLGINLDDGVVSRGLNDISYDEIRVELLKEAPFDDYHIETQTRSANVVSGNDKRLRDEIEVNVEEELMSDPFFTANPIAQLSNEELSKIDSDKIVNQPDPGARGILSLAKLITAVVTVIYKVIKRFVIKRDHGFYPTVVEEILREVYIADAGTWVWGEMKNKAEAMWKPNELPVSPDNLYAGGYFLSGLKKFASQNNDVTIDLVGHSAGAIVICHFVRAFYQEGISAKIRNTIFMAPACRSDLFYQQIVNGSVDIGNFRMFTMSDHWECLDRCIPYVYTRSLLYMISGILEPGEFDAYILGMQRYLSGANPYGAEPSLKAIDEFMKAKENRTVFAVTQPGAANGLQCIAEHHGGFADAATLTMNSIVYILNPVP
ncbi:MAG: alpha/beta hydrolase [Mucilaginibacter sp.]